MPEKTVNIFISAVSDEFASYRKAVVEFVDRKGVRIEEQIGFIQSTYCCKRNTGNQMKKGFVSFGKRMR
jgi:hypothetical protein